MRKRMLYIKINDLDMFYEEFGRGEALLFFHSHFSRGLLAFSAQIQPFSAKYRCLYPDFRGHGRTRSGRLAWNSRMIADDMIGFLGALGISSAHLFGYSCGAYVECYMAAKYPERSCHGRRVSLPQSGKCRQASCRKSGGHHPHFAGEQAKELNPMFWIFIIYWFVKFLFQLPKIIS